MTDSKARSYGWWGAAHAAVLLGLLIPACLVWKALVVPEPSELGITVHGGLYLVRPSVYLWLLPVLTLGLATAGATAELAMRMTLGRQYRDYLSHFGRTEHPSPRVRAFLNGAAVLFLVITSLTLLALHDWYARFGPDDIVVNGFFGLAERHYSYADVMSVHEVRGGVEVQFSDATKWTMADISPADCDGGRSGERVLSKLLSVITARTGLPSDGNAIGTVETDERDAGTSCAGGADA